MQFLTSIFLDVHMQVSINNVAKIFCISWSGLNVLLYGLPKQSFTPSLFVLGFFFKLTESREVSRFVQGQVC